MSAIVERHARADAPLTIITDDGGADRHAAIIERDGAARLGGAANDRRAVVGGVAAFQLTDLWS